MTQFQTRSPTSQEYFGSAHLKTGLKRRAVRGAGATVVSRILQHAVQLIATIVLARLLTPDDFGLVAMVAAFSYLLQNFGIRGFTEATIQSDVISHQTVTTLFWIHVGLSIFVTLLFVALSPLIAWFYDEPRLKLITIIIALSFIFGALSTQHLALLARNMQYFRIMGNELAAMIITSAVVILMACQGFGYWALVARRVLPLIATAFGAWILCRWLPGLPTQIQRVTSLLKFAMNTYGNFATNYLSRNLDKILIGWRHGAQSLGYYERAYYLFMMPVSQLSYPLTSVAVATLSRLRDDTEQYCSYYLKALSVLALVGMPLSAILTIAGKDILLLLLGPQWDSAGKIFCVFGPGIGILLVYGTHGWLHLSIGRADRWFRWGIFELAVTTTAFFLGLPFGPIGLACTYTASFYLLMPLGLWYAGRPVQLKMSSIFSAITRYYLAALVSGLLCWYILFSFDVSSLIFAQLNIIVRIVVSTILCSAIYLVAVLLFYWSTTPISDFFILLANVLPSRKLKS